jgi:hypothetical protein
MIRRVKDPLIFLVSFSTFGCFFSKPPALLQQAPGVRIIKAKKSKKITPKHSAAKRTSAFERLCVSPQLAGCDEVQERKKRALEVDKQVKDHLALYQPLVDQLRMALLTPANVPDGRIEARAVLAPGKLNYDGPHSVNVKVALDYQRGFRRHPRFASIKGLILQMNALNKWPDDQYYKESYNRIASQLTGVTLKLKKPITALIPIAQAKRLQTVVMPKGTAVFALVKTESGQKYGVEAFWRESINPALVLTTDSNGIVIQDTPENTLEYTKQHPVKGEKLCKSLRAELRLLNRGSPRIKWFLRKRTGGSK